MSSPTGTSTHAIQITITVIAIVANVLGLVAVNAFKKKQKSLNDTTNKTNPTTNHDATRILSWEQKRAYYWALMFGMTFLGVWTDARYNISAGWLFVKCYAFAFPLGLLDLYFSNVQVSLRVLPGAALWCSTLFIQKWLSRLYFGRSIPVQIVISLSPTTICFQELPRFVTQLLGVGLFSDFFFSPMHRFVHSPKLYKAWHKEHHSYTNDLTALVLYHGHLGDDFLMPFTTAIGGTVYEMLLSLFGMEDQGLSNFALYLISFNILLSHAHDLRCARLLAPLPDELNYVAYHYVHHISPANNFGLTEPSDRLWDWILGVDTIRKVDSFEQQQQPSLSTTTLKKAE